MMSAATYAQPQPPTGTTSAGAGHVSLSTIIRARSSGSSFTSSASPMSSQWGMPPDGTNYNVNSPGIDVTVFESPNVQQSLGPYIGQGAGDENRPHTDTGDTGGDDQHHRDEGTEGQ